MRSASAPPSSSAAEAGADVAIVGAGPIGLYAAYYAGFRGLTTAIVEAAPFVGGQITAFYPDAEILDAPGFPRVRGRDLVARLEDQARLSMLDLRLGEVVTGIDEHEDGDLSLTTRNAATTAEGSVRARAVLLAVGQGSFAARRIPDPAVKRFEGSGLSYELPAAELLRGRRILVIGGNAQAAESALACDAAGGHCTWIHRRERVAIDASVESRVRESSVVFLPCRDLVALAGEGKVEHAILHDRRDGSEERYPFDLVLPCYGFATHKESLHSLGVALRDDAPAVDSFMATDRARIYAAGDGVSYKGKIRLLAVAFGEACSAINHIAAEIVPGARVFPGFSSHRRNDSRE